MDQEQMDAVVDWLRKEAADESWREDFRQDKIDNLLDAALAIDLLKAEVARLKLQVR